MDDNTYWQLVSLGEMAIWWIVVWRLVPDKFLRIGATVIVIQVALLVLALAALGAVVMLRGAR